MKYVTSIIGLIGMLTASFLPAADTAVDPVQGYHEELGLYITQGRVDYKAWLEYRNGLDRFIVSLEKADLRALSGTEQKALLINA